MSDTEHVDEPQHQDPIQDEVMSDDPDGLNGNNTDETPEPIKTHEPEQQKPEPTYTREPEPETKEVEHVQPTKYNEPEQQKPEPTYTREPEPETKEVERPRKQKSRHSSVSKHDRPEPTYTREPEPDRPIADRKYVTVQSFHYDIDLEGEESYANAAQIKALEERNKKLLSQIDNLEDKLFSSEETRLKLQKDLLLGEEESAEFKSKLDLRDAQNSQLRKEFDDLSARLAEEVSKLAEIESDRRKIEHKKTLLETDVEENKRGQARLDATLTEIEEVRKKVASLLDQKGAAVSNKDRASRSLSELEQKLRAEFFRGRELNKRTTAELDALIETERKRGQQAIDYVRKSLKAKIRQLEVSIDLNRETDLDFKKEKRRVARELKQVNRKLDDQKSQSTHNERHIESLTKQLSSLKESCDKDSQLKVSLETDIANLEREVGTLSAQYNAACRINAKLNAMAGAVKIEQDDVEEAPEAQTPVENAV